uniref:PiggyBac transposable element-derived protein domain-containing protein n=1 Tax=Bionectria ochroleuca TaxID=29856 RepID=A0A8H7N642_BIOOC
MKDLPDHPVDLFQLFCPESLVIKWASWTNAWVEFLIEQAGDSLSPTARLRRWKRTSVAELYIWLSVLIYIGSHPQTRIEDYWVTSSIDDDLRPTYPIIQYMTYDRFHLLFRYIRIFPPFESTSDSLNRMISRVSEWSDHIQHISTSLFEPGTAISVDECMIRFKGRSSAKVTIPRKPTPTGLKVWAAAQQGYFLRWRFHLPAAAVKATRKPSQRRRPRGLLATKKAADEISLAETQAVVLDLVLQLPIASYHVFFDNLFSTPDLLRALRERGVAATGTARVNSGIYKPFVKAKEQDNKGQLMWPYNKLEAVSTADDLVNQIAFKDNSLVLFLTSYFTGDEVEDHKRKRPSSSHRRARQAQLFFGDIKELIIPTPSIVISYNHQMNGVDRGDQLRANCSYKHRIRRGPWQALAWTFLLETILTNTYILQRKSQSSWKPADNQKTWRRQLCNDIIRVYRHDGASRKNFTSGDRKTVYSQHKHVPDFKSRECQPCKGIQIGQIHTRSSSKRPALAQIDGNAPKKRGRRTEYGCSVCQVPICTSQNCWYFYHQQIIT